MLKAVVVLSAVAVTSLAGAVVASAGELSHLRNVQSCVVDGQLIEGSCVEVPDEVVDDDSTAGPRVERTGPKAVVASSGEAAEASSTETPTAVPVATTGLPITDGTTVPPPPEAGLPSANVPDAWVDFDLDLGPVAVDEPLDDEIDEDEMDLLAELEDDDAADRSHKKKSRKKRSKRRR